MYMFNQSIKSILLEYNLKAELDVLEGSMTVKTSRQTWDPYIIIKARDMIKLMARSVPYEQAIKVLQVSYSSLLFCNTDSSSFQITQQILYNFLLIL